MVKVIGFRPIKGTSAKTGKVFDAVVFMCVDDFPRAGQVGCSVFEQFVTRSLADEALKTAGFDFGKALGHEVDFSFSRGGFVQGVSIL